MRSQIYLCHDIYAYKGAVKTKTTAVYINGKPYVVGNQGQVLNGEKEVIGWMTDDGKMNLRLGACI